MFTHQRTAAQQVRQQYTAGINGLLTLLLHPVALLRAMVVGWQRAAISNTPVCPGTPLHCCHTCMTLLTCPAALDQITQMQLTGSWSNSQLRDAVELAMGGCMQLKAMMRQVLLDAATASRQDQ